MYDRILVPLKGDSTDEAVVAHTGALARLSGGKVTLLRVIHSHSRDEATFLEEQARAYLDAQVARLAGDGRGRGRTGGLRVSRRRRSSRPRGDWPPT